MVQELTKVATIVQFATQEEEEEEGERGEEEQEEEGDGDHSARKVGKRSPSSPSPSA